MPPFPSPALMHRFVLVTLVNISHSNYLTTMDWNFRLTVPEHGNDSPSVNSDKISESKEVKKWLDNYLGMGEWIMDQSVAVLGSSGWFKRER